MPYETFDDFLSAVNGTQLTEPLLEAGVYTLRIKSARKVPAAKRPGGFNYLVIMSSVDHPEAKDIFEYLPIPLPSDPAKSVAYMLKKMGQFLAAAKLSGEVFRNVTEDGGDEGLVGQTLPAEVALQPERVDGVTGKTYQAGNSIDKYIFSHN